MIMPTVPVAKMVSGVGSSSPMSFCAARNTRRSLELDSAMFTASTEISRETRSGTIMYGNTTRSRMGKSGIASGISKCTLPSYSSAGASVWGGGGGSAAVGGFFGLANRHLATAPAALADARQHDLEHTALETRPHSAGVGRTRQVDHAPKWTICALGALEDRVIRRYAARLAPLDNQLVARHRQRELALGHARHFQRHPKCFAILVNIGSHTWRAIGVLDRRERLGEQPLGLTAQSERSFRVYLDLSRALVSHRPGTHSISWPLPAPPWIPFWIQPFIPRRHET